MNEREIKIAQAAIRAYSNLGVKSATMAEIAKEANVTRQTVYNIFPSTDDVLRAAIRYYIDQQWNKIFAGWGRCNSLSEKIDLLLHYFALEPWEHINSSPEAAEMERGYNEAGKAEVEAAREGFRDEIAQLFVPYGDVLLSKGTSPHAVADFIGAAFEGIKYNNAEREAMLIAVATLKAALISLTMRAP